MIISGNDLIFEIELISNPSPEIQWFREETLLMSSERFVITFTDNIARIVIKNVTIEDAGKYTLIVSNSMGSATVAANARVIGMFGVSGKIASSRLKSRKPHSASLKLITVMTRHGYDSHTTDACCCEFQTGASPTISAGVKSTI